MCLTKLDQVRLKSDFGATAGSDGVFASNLIRATGGNNFRRENMRSEFANSVQIEKLWLTHFAVFMLLYQYLGKQIQTQGSVFVFRQVFTRLNRLVNGKSNKLGYYHEEKAKKWICAKETCLHSLVSHKSKAYWYFVVFIFSDDFELHAWLVTPLNFEPITSPVIW